jgi:hypothetical protein
MKTHALSAAAALLCSVILHAETPVNPTGSQSALHGPVTHKNLQIFLIKGEDRLREVKVKILDEAMKEKSAVVRETGSVNQLSIENKGGEGYVFVQSGDIVKGGRQDRTLPNDILVKAGSGKLPIDAFCVEHGRWQQRGKESAAAFSGSTKALSSKDLKYAAKVEKSQAVVWDKVEKEQKKLSANVYKDGAKPHAAPQASASNDAQGQNVTVSGAQGQNATVNDARSASSLQLALENRNLEKLAKEYTDDLKAAPAQAPDAVGFAYAVNGTMTGAEVYANHALFLKLWPKLLESVVNEAIAEQQDDKDGSALSCDVAGNWLGETEIAELKREDYPAGNATLKRDAKKSVRFDTLVPAAKGKGKAKESDWIHRSILSKEGIEPTTSAASQQQGGQMESLQQQGGRVEPSAEKK